MITILKQMIFNMSRKKYLTESIEDFGKQIVNNVYDTLIQWNYDQGEIDSIVGRDSIELDITDGKCVLHCGNEIIYSTPSIVLIHKFAPAAEDALLNWCIKKIGREPERIDANDLFSDVPGWNNTNESKIIKLTESELKKVITESVKNVLAERIKSEIGMTDDQVRARRNKNYREDRDDIEYQSLHPYTEFGPSYDDLHDFDWFANPEEMERRTDSSRCWKHKALQNHRYPNDDGEYEDVY
jgi:hypothetical protein